MLPIEKAYYRAKAKTWELGETKKGEPQVGIDFVIVDGDHKGAHIPWYGYFSEKTEDRTLESLRICGWTGTDISDLTGLDKNEVEIACEPEDATNEDGSPKIDETTGEVKQRLRVRWVNRGGGLTMKTKLGDDKKKMLAARMKQRLAVLDAKAPRAPSAGAPPPAPRSNGAASGPPPGHPAGDGGAPIDDIQF